MSLLARALDSLERSPRAWLLGIMAVAIALRFAVVLLFPQTIISLGNREKSDDVATSFLATGAFGQQPGQPSSFMRPGYAWFLTGLYATLGRGAYTIGLSQALLSSLNVLLAYLVARELVGRKSALLAGMAMAIYPYPVWHDVHVVRTGLDTFFCLSSVLFLLRLVRTSKLWYAAAAGATLVGASQTTNLLVGFIPVAALWLLFSWRSWRRTALATLAIGGVALLSFTPWIVRNYGLHGRLVPFTTENGPTFYKNNNPHILGLVRQNLGPDHVMPFLPGDFPAGSRERLYFEQLTTSRYPPTAMTEAEADAVFLRHGLDWLRVNPSAKLEMAMYMVVNHWDPSRIRPRSDTFFEGDDAVSRLKNVLYTLSFGPILVLGLIGLLRRLPGDRRRWLVLLVFAFSTALFALTYSSTRYRIPFDGLLAAYAAETLLVVLAWLSGWREFSPSDVSPARRAVGIATGQD